MIVDLRPAVYADTSFIRAVDTEHHSRPGWRDSPSESDAVDTYARVWRGADLMRVIKTTASGIDIGYACAYDTDMRAGTTWVAAAVMPEWRRHGSGALGFGLFLNEVFIGLRCRWVYLSISERAEDHSRSLFELAGFHSLGTIRGRIFDGAGSIDERILGVEREEWLDGWGAAVRSYADRLSGALRQMEAVGESAAGHGELHV